MERGIAPICCVLAQRHFLRCGFILVSVHKSQGGDRRSENSSGSSVFVCVSLFTDDSFSVWLTDSGRWLLLLVQRSSRRKPPEPPLPSDLHEWLLDLSRVLRRFDAAFLHFNLPVKSLNLRIKKGVYQSRIVFFSDGFWICLSLGNTANH